VSVAAAPATASAGVHLALASVSKSYGDVAALDEVSLAVPPGALLTLLGPSGCGKSTLLRIIAGFVHPTSGRVLLGGRDVGDVPPFRRETAMVFQSYALFPHMRVLENVKFGLRMRKVDNASATRRAGEALEMVRLSGFADRFPSQLSGGQQQRAALARALVTDPKVLLLDEPFGALDKALRDVMQVELRKLQQSVGVTTICVTHDQQEAMTISDRIAVMRNGRVEQYGTPLEIHDSPRTEFVARFVGAGNILRAQVIADGAGECVVRPAQAGEVRLRMRGSLRPGQEVLLAIRPGAVQLLPPGGRDPPGGGLSVPAQVAFSVNLGTRVSYELTLADGFRLLAEVQRTASTAMLANGARVTAFVPGEACVLMER
jgi:ABC-type Fe3+/spermidine/putrescine transport system ATPase subunit